MLQEKITKNFIWKEVLTSDILPDYYIIPTPQQVFCYKTLFENLIQPIRDRFGRIRITSGLRDEVIYQALRRSGYPASTRSDHFAWCHLNPIGSGAVDFTPVDADLFEVHRFIYRKMIEGTWDVNQLIIYPEMKIIHISNPRSAIFKFAIDSRRKFLIFDKGKYRPWEDKASSSSASMPARIARSLVHYLRAIKVTQGDV